jgi:hypothetical protein
MSREEALQIEAAKVAINSVLRRIVRDPRIAYYFDPLTDSFEKLTAAHAALHGLDVTKVRADMAAVMKYEAPTLELPL